MQRSKAGVPGLDEVLCGGLIAQQLYLVDGHPGAGKTTLALQYLLEGVNNGEKCTYVTLSETKQELEAGAHSHGWKLDGIEIIELIPSEEELRGEEQLTMLPASEVELGETTRKVLEAVERSAPTRMVFDSLSELRLLAQTSLRYRRQILAFKQFFVGRRCTVIMIDDRTSEGPDLQLHSIAHGVIALNSYAPAYGRIRRELQVIKFRGSKFIDGFHDFTIRQGGLTVFPRLVAADHNTSFERALIPSGTTALDAALEPLTVGASDTDASAHETTGRRILIADDNKDAADALAMILELGGHEVRVAHNGRVALSLAQTFRPDVALLDIGMPDMSGYEVARALRHERWGKEIYLVALTGWGQEGDRQKALDAGFDRHMTKPIDPDALESFLSDGRQTRRIAAPPPK